MPAMQITKNTSKQASSGKKTVVRTIVLGLTIFLSIFLIFVATWSIHSHLASKPVALTLERQLEDFDYLVRILSENYPYLAMHARTEGLNWEAAVADARAKIAAGVSGTDAIQICTELLDRLNRHTYFIPSSSYLYFLEVFNQSFMIRFISCKPWADVLESPRALGNYGKVNRRIRERIGNPFTFLQDISRWNFTGKKTVAQSPTVKTSVIEQGRIAYLYFPTFTNFDADRQPTLEFLTSVKDYEWIIIDIRGNSGGSTWYVSSLIVPALISKNLEHTAYALVRPGNYIKPFLKARDLKIEPLSKLPAFPRLAPETKTDYIGFIHFSDIIRPAKTPIGFKGHVVLLVDGKVYSASEHMAYVCKSTGFATIVGETTGGDGIGIDVAVAMLPNSGYVFTFPPEAGLNPDGSFNEETNTVPDVEIAPGEDALQKTLELIASGWKGRDFER